jgi:hypothetical protein
MERKAISEPVLEGVLQRIKDVERQVRGWKGLGLLGATKGAGGLGT